MAKKPKLPAVLPKADHASERGTSIPRGAFELRIAPFNPFAVRLTDDRKDTPRKADQPRRRAKKASS